MKPLAALLAILGLLAAGLFLSLRGERVDAPRRLPAGVETRASLVADEEAPRLEAPHLDDGASADGRSAIEAGEATPPLATAPTDESRGAVVVARVLDDRRRPVADAKVELFDAEEPSRVERSDSEGRVRFTIPCRDEARVVFAGLLASDGVSRAATTAIHFGLPAADAWSGATHDAGDLVLEPAGPVRVDVRADGAPIAGARVEIDIGFERLPCGATSTDESGRARFELVPFGRVAAQATSATSTGSVRSTEEQGERALSIDLTPGRAVNVRVIDRATSLPIEGARVSLEVRVLGPTTMHRAGDPAYVEHRAVPGRTTHTDAGGRALVTGLPHDIELWAIVDSATIVSTSRPPEPSATCSLVPSVDHSELAFEVERLVPHDVTVPVVPGELAVPPDGTLVHVRRRPDHGVMVVRLPEEARIEGSAIRLRDVVAGEIDAFAETDEGAIARMLVDGDDPEFGAPTSFVRARRILVHVQDERGTPLAGAGLYARADRGSVLDAWVETDASGLAILAGLMPGRVNVLARSPGDAQDPGSIFAMVDVEHGDGEITIELPVRMAVDLRFWIDGEPRLPAKLVTFGARIERELPDEGRMVLVKAPDPAGRVGLGLLAQGFVRVSLVLGPEELARHEPIDVHLVREAAILARVERPGDARIRLAVERWHDEGQQWLATQGWQDVRYPNDEDGLFLFDELEPGLVRVRDAESGLSSESIELRAGERVEVVLDLNATELVRGRVVGSDSSDVSGARVLIVGDEVERFADAWNAAPGVPANALRLGRGGRFELRIPTDGSVELVAWHPWLRPDPKTGRAVVRSSTEEIVLRLAEGPSAQLALPAEIRGWRAGLHVLLFRGEPGDAPPVADVHAAISGNGARFGGYEPGRYTLWIDPQRGYAPVVVRDVELGAGSTDLGAPEFTAGSRLVLHVTAPAGQEVPRLNVTVTPTEPPHYRRGTSASGQTQIVVPGLGKGDFRVVVQATPRSPGVVLDEEVTLDGETEVTLELELR